MHLFICHYVHHVLFNNQYNERLSKRWLQISLLSLIFTAVNYCLNRMVGWRESAGGQAGQCLATSYTANRKRKTEEQVNTVSHAVASSSETMPTQTSKHSNRFDLGVKTLLFRYAYCRLSKESQIPWSSQCRFKLFFMPK